MNATRSADKVDVLAYHDAMIASHKALSADAYHVQELPKAEAVRAAVAELIEAASYYYHDYMQDEADGFACGKEQQDAAARVRDALANIGAAA